MNVLARLTAAVIGLASMACSDEGWESETIALGVGDDLWAVSSVGGWGGPVDGYIAAGESGLVVMWAEHVPKRENRIIRVSDVGNRDLKAVSYISDARLIAVGEGGAAARSDDHGVSWTSLDLGVSADLHAIISVVDTDFPTLGNVEAHDLILGNDVVLIAQPDGTWAEFPAPEGGWGELRAGAYWYQTYFVGLGGVVWTNEDPFDPASPWISEPTGTTADLFAVEGGPGGDDDYTATMLVAGANGTLLLHNQMSGWQPIESGWTVDFLDYTDFTLLTSEGEVIRVSDSGGQLYFASIETYPGALALHWKPSDRIAVVGIDGLAAQLSYHADVPYW